MISAISRNSPSEVQWRFFKIFKKFFEIYFPGKWAENRLIGPGEWKHMSQGNTPMLSFFVTCRRRQKLLSREIAFNDFLTHEKYVLKDKFQFRYFMWLIIKISQITYVFLMRDLSLDPILANIIQLNWLLILVFDWPSKTVSQSSFQKRSFLNNTVEIHDWSASSLTKLIA